MNGGNTNNSSSEDEQRLVMLGKTAKNILINYISRTKRMLKVFLLNVYQLQFQLEMERPIPMMKLVGPLYSGMM